MPHMWPFSRRPKVPCTTCGRRAVCQIGLASSGETVRAKCRRCAEAWKRMILETYDGDTFVGLFTVHRL